jgi:hypothetical protein
MVSIFWDKKGLLIVEFMQQGTTTTSEVYWTVLKTAQGQAEQKAWNADIQ